MCPLVKEFQKHPNEFKTIVCVMGQHREMLDQVLRIFEVVPDIDLNIMKQGQDLVDKDCIIEDNVLLNVGVTIAHDSRVKEHSFLSPRVAIAGFSTIGKRCMVGINSTIIDNVTVCDDVRLGGYFIDTQCD